MTTAPLRHLRRNVVAYVAVFFALGAGGGYAIAATSTKTFTACADNKTGVLHLSRNGRCARKQTRIRWNQRGPQGIRGATGRTGPQGPPAATAWAIMGSNGSLFQGHGVTAQRQSAGTYLVTITAPGCQGDVAPSVTVSDANPPNGQPAGTFPVAWVQDGTGTLQFRVFTGVVSGGVFTPTDHTFNVQDTCS